MCEDGKNKDGNPKFKFDIQGLIRMAITIGTIVIAYCVDRDAIKSNLATHCDISQREIATVKSDIAVLKAVRVRSTEELSEVFVTRREWESGNKDLKSELRYIRDRLDAIYQMQRNGK